MLTKHEIKETLFVLEEIARELIERGYNWDDGEDMERKYSIAIARLETALEEFE